MEILQLFCDGNQFKTKNQCFWRTDLHCRAAILKWIGLSEQLWAGEKRIEFGYIVYKFGEIGTVTPEFCLLILVLV